MYSPFLLDFVRKRIWLGKLRILHHMRQLKDNTRHQSADKGDNNVTNKSLYPSYHNNGNNQIDTNVHQLGDPKNQMLFCGKFHRFAVSCDSPAKILLEILVKNPRHIRDPIKNKPIQMLK